MVETSENILINNVLILFPETKLFSHNSRIWTSVLCKDHTLHSYQKSMHASTDTSESILHKLSGDKLCV